MQLPVMWQASHLIMYKRIFIQELSYENSFGGLKIPYKSVECARQGPFMAGELMKMASRLALNHNFVAKSSRLT